MFMLNRDPHHQNAANPTKFSKDWIKPIKCKSKVAILLATYNGDKYLTQQLESVINQTFDDWTVFISDDGSYDRTTSIIGEYTTRYPDKFIQLNLGQRKGCSNNFYALMFSVNAKYYMFCDQDDVWLPDKIAKSISIIDGTVEPTIVASDSMTCDYDLKILSYSYWDSKKINRNDFLSFNRSAVLCCVGGAEMIFNNAAKKLLIDNVNNSLTYDHWLLMNVCKYGNVILIGQSLRLYRQHDGNIFGSNDKKRNQKKLFERIKHFYNDYLYLQDVDYGSFFKYCIMKTICFYLTKIKPKLK